MDGQLIVAFKKKELVILEQAMLHYINTAKNHNYIELVELSELRSKLGRDIEKEIRGFE